MSYMWFWVHWLVEHTPKSVKYRFAKFGYLTGSDPKEKAKIILRYLFWEHYPTENIGKN